MTIQLDDEVTWSPEFKLCHANFTVKMFMKIAVFVLCLAFLFYRIQVYLTFRQEKAELHLFLRENALLDYEIKLHKFGKCVS